MSSAPPLQEVLQRFAGQNSPIDEAKILYEGAEKCGCCINWTETYPEDVKESVEATTESKRYAIIYRLQKSHTGTKKPLQLHSIVVQSAKLKSVLGEVFADYPGVTTTLEELTFSAPFQEFFHRWNALVSKAEEQHDSVARAHTQLLIDTLTLQLGDDHGIARDMIQNNVITFDYLWTLFPPGVLLFSRQHDEDHIVELVKAKYTPWYRTDAGLPGRPQMRDMSLSCRYIDWDGKAFGWKEKEIEIPYFSGTHPIQDLKMYPVTSHSAEQLLRSKMVDRGRKFVSLAGCHHRSYRDITRSPDKDSSAAETSYAWSPLFNSARATLADQHDRLKSVSSSTRKSFAKYSYRWSSSLDPAVSEGRPLRSAEDFSDHLFMLCSPTVKAYGLGSKRWSKHNHPDFYDPRSLMRRNR